MAFARIRPKRGTAAQWNSANTVLAEGEIGVEVPSSGVGKGASLIKIGDGSTAWKSLPYAINPYPVGSVYISVNNTSPATLFGGTWVQIKDTFLLAAGSTYTAGKTGGTAGNTLTYNNLPPRTVVSTKNTGSSAASIGFVASNATNLEANRYGDVALQDTTNKTDLSANYGTGGQDKLNNMPPYLAVYVWKRTA